MDSTGRFNRIDEDKEIGDLRSVAGDILESPVLIKTSWLKQQGWVIACVENPIDYLDAERLARAGNSRGFNASYALSTDVEGYAYRLTWSQEGILSFNRHLTLQRFLILPNHIPEYCVLMEGDYYFLVAGPETFVREVLCVSFDVANLMFRRYVEQMIGDAWQQALLAMIELYRPFNGEDRDEVAFRRLDID